MKNNEKEILAMFNGKLIGNRKMKKYVCKTVLKLPKKIRSFITQKCWFISSMDDAWAFAFTGNDLANRHLIFLSDDLLRQNEKQIYHTITHEIGHVVLGHRNSTLVRQTRGEIRRQEREADEFVKLYQPAIY